MIDYAGLRATYRARFLVHERTVVVVASNPPGLALVVWEPRVEGGRVIFNAGVASAGSGGEHASCFRLDAPALPANGSALIYWREPGGSLRAIEVERGDEARQAATRCSR